MHKMVTTTGALAAGSAHHVSDAGSRWAVAEADDAEVVDSRRCWEFGQASSGRLRNSAVLPSNKPLQRIWSPQRRRRRIEAPAWRRPDR